MRGVRRPTVWIWFACVCEVRVCVVVRVRMNVLCSCDCFCVCVCGLFPQTTAAGHAWTQADFELGRQRPERCALVDVLAWSFHVLRLFVLAGLLFSWLFGTRRSNVGRSYRCLMLTPQPGHFKIFCGTQRDPKEVAGRERTNVEPNSGFGEEGRALSMQCTGAYGENPTLGRFVHRSSSS